MYPPKCVICGCIIDSGHDGVCSSCYKDLSYINYSRCIRCSKAVDEDEVLCSDCKRTEHIYKQGYAVWKYDKVSKTLIMKLKYYGVKDIAGYISAEMSYHSRNLIKKWNPEVLIPVPLHISRYRKRGFNQAELIAKGIGNIYDIPVADDALIRNHKTHVQKHLNNEDRYINLKEAFAADPSKLKKYGRIRSAVIVDDIYTTGSTIDGCAAALKTCGIENVYFLCACIGDGF